MQRKKYHKLDFDYLTGLARTDPQRFESFRRATIEAYISGLPDKRQTRMRKLQWRIDQERRRHSPMGACLKISGMMWDHLLGPQGLIGMIQGGEPAQRKAASIIPFPGDENP
jgi:hypothetical protein